MLKEGLRIIGISFVLAGIFLFLSTPAPEGSYLQEENKELKKNIAQLQDKLQQTEQELANLQTLSAEANESRENLDEKIDHLEDPPSKENTHATTILLIESGTSSTDVATQLVEAQIINDATAFNDYLKEQQLTTKIQIGEYTIDASMPIEAIATIITTLPGEG